MRKKLLFLFGGIAICALIAMNLTLNSHSNHLINLSLSSAEALADGGEGGEDCDWGNEYFWGTHHCVGYSPYITVYEECESWPANRGNRCSSPGEKTHLC